MSPLTLDYVTSTGLAATSQTYQHTHAHHIAITALCHHEQTPHHNNPRLPLDLACLLHGHTSHHTTVNRQAQAPRKSVMQDVVPFLTYLGRCTPSDSTASSFPSPGRRPNQTYAMLLAVPRLPSTNGITVCGLRAALNHSQLPEMRRSDACNIKTDRCCCATAVDTNILVNIPDLLVSKIGIA